MDFERGTDYWGVLQHDGSKWEQFGVSSSIGLALAALGSETSGSILSPSQRNCLAGIKPSVELTSRYLVVPISQEQFSA